MRRLDREGVPIAILSLVWPLVLVEVVLKVIALRDLAAAPSETVRGENRLVWAFIVIIFSGLGPIFYLTWGRRR